VMVVVPDASVLVKWVLPSSSEKDQRLALDIRNGAMREELLLKVPSLWLYEVGNTLTRRFPKQAGSLLAALTAFGFDEPQWNEAWLEECVALVKRYQVTFYDAAYHSLALMEAGMFVTADRQYVQATRKAGGVVLLDDWKL
jgi:predicted nucleic acid-binding protein